MLLILFQRLYKRLRDILKGLLRKVIALTIFFIIIGTVGFYFLEAPRFTVWQSFYWTIITITTIGFGDIAPTSMGGQTLAIVLAFFGVALVSLLFATIMSVILDTQFFKTRRFMRMARKMDDITLILGFNERVRILIQELSTEGIKIVMVDKKPLPADWDEKWGPYIQGDPSEDYILLKAGVEKAKKALVSLSDDGDTLLAILSIQHLTNGKCLTIAEVISKGNIQHFKRVKCDQIICQDEILGKFLNITLLLPSIFPAYEELISMEGNEIYFIEEHIGEYLDKTFEEVVPLVKKKYDAMLIGYIRQSKTFLNPDFNVKLQKGDTLLVISETFVE
ncbi:MAG TPA: potassium channel protein [Candidatus Deferrimicrobium sp.]|nr:potassium channel protein [Candidatus Deferrimicrobium sp.]